MKLACFNCMFMIDYSILPCNV